MERGQEILWEISNKLGIILISESEGLVIFQKSELEGSEAHLEV